MAKSTITPVTGQPSSDLDVDLSTEQKLLLLKNDFPWCTEKHVRDALKKTDYRYEEAYVILKKQVSKEKRQKPVATKSTDTAAASNGTVLLMITPELFKQLHDKFGDSDGDRCPRQIAKCFEVDGCLQLPLEHQTALAIYSNILQFVGPTLTGRGDGRRVSVGEPARPPPSVKKGVIRPAPPPPDESPANLAEIMAMEAALTASREEYINELAVKATGGSLDGQTFEVEVCIQKKLAYLKDLFPGLAGEQIDIIFEQNCFNVDDTIQYIEDTYKLVSSASTTASAFDSAFSSTGSTSGSSSEVDVCTSGSDYDELATNNSDGFSTIGVSDSTSAVVIKAKTSQHRFAYVNDEQFMAKIKQLVMQRERHYGLREKAIKRKRGAVGLKNQAEIQRKASAEVKKNNEEMGNISKQIMALYRDYSYPANEIDLHGLIQEEARVVFPEFLRRKLATRGKWKRIKVKVITGVGQTIRSGRAGTMRDYVKQFLMDNNLHFDLDGQGAFYINLTSRSGLRCAQ